MNLKLKKELRERQSTLQLMGIVQLTAHGVKTAAGELVFFLLQPDNLSVLSAEGVRGRVLALANLLRGMESARLLALDSRESFQHNKDWYHQRMEAETMSALRELLRRDSEHLDHIRLSTASAREFALALTLDQEADEGRLYQLEKTIRDAGFRVRLADGQDVKRLLAVYYQKDVTTEFFENFDGERWLKF